MLGAVPVLSSLRPPGGFSCKMLFGFVAPQSKIHQEYSPALRLAIRPFARKQNSSEFSERLLKL
jgi:hypothetical protein